MPNPEVKSDSKRVIKRKGVFLAVLDGTEESSNAVEYACQFAAAEGGYVSLLNIIEKPYVAGWGDIEARVQKEARAQAEEIIWGFAGSVLEKTGNIPIVCIEEGDRSDIIVKTIEENKSIVALVLAPSSASSNPGPLITYFSGKGLSRLPIPLLISPVEKY